MPPVSAFGRLPKKPRAETDVLRAGRGVGRTPLSHRSVPHPARVANAQPARGAPHDRARDARPSGFRAGPHPHTSTLAAERRPSTPQGVDRRRHAAAGAKPCVRMGSQSPATGRAYQPHKIQNDMQSWNTPEPRQRMPYCDSCLHRGEDHNWRVPPCHECEGQTPGCLNCRRKRELRRLRGACLIYECICSKYVPLRFQRRSANPLLGRFRYRKWR